MNQFIITVLQGDVVRIVFQVLRLQWVNALVIAEVVQLKFVFDPDLLLTAFFLLVVGGARKALQAALFFDTSVINVPVFAFP